MQVVAALCEQFVPFTRLLADQIVHLDPPGSQAAIAKRQSANCADMVLELARDRAFDRPVAAIVHTRRHFVEYRTGVGSEKLAGQHTNIAHRLCHARRECACFFLLFYDRGRRRDQRMRQDPAFMDIMRCVPIADLAVLAAHQDYRKFMAESDKALGHALLPTDRVPVAGKVVAGLDARLALAVIAHAHRLQDRRRANIGDRLFEGRQVIDGCERGGTALMVERKLFLGNAVLGDIKRADRRI